MISDFEEELFLSKKSVFYSFLSSFDYPWQALGSIQKYTESLIAAARCGSMTLFGMHFFESSDGVLIADDCAPKIAENATILAPSIIFSGCEIRSGAYIRGNAIIGHGCVIGNSSEVKNCLFLDSVKIPHFNYVGDSVLFDGVHLGAGAIVSNVRCDKAPVRARFRDLSFDTGLKKFGAIIGGGCEIGCGCVINPGTIIAKNSVILPLSSVKGYIVGKVF